MEAVWYVMLAVTVILFVLLYVKVFPKIILRKKYNVNAPSGRGIKVIREKSDDKTGTTILCVPDIRSRRYIPQYLVTERDGRKQLVCRTAESVAHIGYDIAVFDDNNCLKKVEHAEHSAEKSGCTPALGLPSDTAYVNVYATKVNGKKVPCNLSSEIPGGRWTLYIFLCSLMIIAVVFIVRYCLGELFGGIYSEFFITSDQSIIVACVVCAVLILANIFFTVLVFKKLAKGSNEA